MLLALAVGAECLKHAIIKHISDTTSAGTGPASIHEDQCQVVQTLTFPPGGRKVSKIGGGHPKDEGKGEGMVGEGVRPEKRETGRTAPLDPKTCVRPSNPLYSAQATYSCVAHCGVSSLQGINVVAAILALICSSGRQLMTRL